MEYDIETIEVLHGNALYIRLYKMAGGIHIPIVASGHIINYNNLMSLRNKLVGNM